MKMESMRREKKGRQAPAASAVPTAVRRTYEAKYGVGLQDVRVHYNSPQPERLGALAYAAGSEIHLGPGQEKYLRHELGHVIQQKLGPVRRTGLINGQAVNQDPALERQADQLASLAVPAYQGAGAAVGGAVAQLAKAEVTCQIDGAEHRLYAEGERGAKGTGGRDHAEQLAWGKSWKAVKDISDGVKKKESPYFGKKIDVIFTVDTPICPGCQDWFENQLYLELTGWFPGGFGLFVRVGGSTVEVRGDETIWTKHVGEVSTLDRLSPFQQFEFLVANGFNHEQDVEDDRVNGGLVPLKKEFHNLAERGLRQELEMQYEHWMNYRITELEKKRREEEKGLPKVKHGPVVEPDTLRLLKKQIDTMKKVSVYEVMAGAAPATVQALAGFMRTANKRNIQQISRYFGPVIDSYVQQIRLG